MVRKGRWLSSLSPFDTGIAMERFGLSIQLMRCEEVVGFFWAVLTCEISEALVEYGSTTVTGYSHQTQAHLRFVSTIDQLRGLSVEL